MTDTLGATIGNLFSNFGQYLIGGAELLTSLVLLLPIILYKYRARLHFWGALMAVAVMAGAIFFHLFTPLGWHPTWAVSGATDCHAVFLEATSQCSDTSLANAAVSIFLLGLIVAFLNRKVQ